MADLLAQLDVALRDRYTVERELGRGGMAMVFLARDRKHDRLVALKVLRPEFAASLGAERFLLEIRIAAQLSHPHILALYDSGSADGLLYYAMPYVAGESLRARLRRECQLPLEETLRIAHQAASALDYAHRCGVVHRDIKPENILLYEGEALVADFGIAYAVSAAAADRLTETGLAVGTPAYMSPEQAFGDGPLDGRSDIYSLGCVVYEMLAGDPPFTGSSANAILARKAAEPAPPLRTVRDTVAETVERAVMRALARSPADRFTTGQAFVDALGTITSDGGSQARPSLLPGSAGTFRKALLIYAASFAAVAMLARAAITGIGLPEWVFPGALVVMALGLPVVLWTGYVQRVVRRRSTASLTHTSGGTPRVTHGPIATMALQASPHMNWRRTTWSSALALGAFAAFVTGYMIMRAYGIGPFGSLLASGGLSPDKTVLVSEFRTTATDTSLGLTVAEGVRLGLLASNAIHVMTPGEIGKALERMERAATARVDFATAREIAAREAVTAIVDGEVAGVGTGYIIRLRLVSADSGLELFSDQRPANGDAEVFGAIDALTRSLRGRIGESLKRVNAAPALHRETTASLDALKWYTRGIIAHQRDGNAATSAEFHRRAVGADSSFALAWRALGTMYTNIGASRAQRDSALERAYRFRDKLGKTDQNRVAAAYFAYGPGRDRGKAISIYQELLADGDTNVAANNLAMRLTQRREYAAAESLLTWMMRHDPRIVQPRRNLVFAQVQRGELASADSTVAAFNLREFPPLMRYAHGDMTDTASVLDSTGFSRGIAAVRGRVSAARRLHTRASALQAYGLSPVPPLLDTIAFGLLDVILGNGGRAAARLDAALDAGLLRQGAPIDRPYLLVATLYAQAGRADRAREVLRERTQDIRDTSLIRAEAPGVHLVMGEIALAERRGRDAVSEFWRSDSLPDGPASSSLRYTYALVARAYDAAKESDSAIVYLERYLMTPDFFAAAPLFTDPSRTVSLIAPDPLYLAPAHERLGQLYEARGDMANAVVHYGKFVDLWKNADPELQSRVTEARSRLARISRIERRQ